MLASFISVFSNTRNIQDVGFEPDPHAFECLLLNVNDYSNKLFNGLSSKEGKAKLYLDTFGANSSIEQFGSEEFINIETKL